MLYQVLIPAPVLMIPILVMTTKGVHQTPTNESNLHSDVIVTYSNHAEAGDVRIEHLTERSTESSVTVLATEYTTVKIRRPAQESSDGEEPFQEDVVFVPNDKEILRNEDYLQHDGTNIRDLMGGHKTVEEILAAKDVRLETESPNTDIIFVMGKNNENMDQTEKLTRKWSYNDNPFRTDDFSTSAPRLDCKNLMCNNTIKSVCGAKIDNYQQKFRLFMNHCYFRKVNCNFKSPVNRYKQVTINNCKNLVAHYNHTPFTIKPSRKLDMKPVQVNNTRRSPSSRRSMTMSVSGDYCLHPCPTFCPESYEPECAVSSTGRHRVFVNHCALDQNSCSFGIVWRSVPLAECVGGKKADMRQNSGFIGWMQRVGIVDKKGRLVMNP